jgi:hypothetical protein
MTPKGSFIIRNVFTQPVMLLDRELYCNYNGRNRTQQYDLWDQHILPPGGQLEPIFDYTGYFTKTGIRVWSPGWESYQRKVTASDLSKTVALTYKSRY